MSPHIWSSLLPAGVLVFSLLHHHYKMTCIQIGCGSTSITSFHPNYVFQGPLFRYGCMARQRKVGFQYVDLGEYNSPLTTMEPSASVQAHHVKLRCQHPHLVFPIPPSTFWSFLHIMARITAALPPPLPPSLSAFLFPSFLPLFSPPFLFSFCLSTFSIGDGSQCF